MANKLMPIREDDRGAVAVIVAILLTVFIGFAALAVDVGYLYETRRQLQSAADAGALAGCQEMVQNAQDPNVVTKSQNVARDYAINKNLAQEATPTVDLADQSVTVVASRTVDLFFARIFGVTDKTVAATSKAQVAYLVGAKDIMPLGVPNPKPHKVEVAVVDQSTGTRVGIYELGGGNFVNDHYDYSGSISTPATGDYRIDVIRINNQNVEDDLLGASALMVKSVAGQLGAVSISPNFITAGTSTSVTISANVYGSPTSVEATWPKANGNGSYSVTLQHDVGDLYKATTTINMDSGYPAGAVGYGSYPVTIKVNGTQLPDIAAYIVVKDPGCEVNSCNLGTTCVVGGTPSSISVTVSVQGFEYGKLYTLFLDNGSSGYQGNYYGFDLDYAEYAPGTGLPDSPSGGHGNSPGGNGWSNGLAGTLHADPWASTHPYHYYQVGDYICTKTGSMVGPLKQGIQDRINGDTCDYLNNWVSGSTPHASKYQ